MTTLDRKKERRKKIKDHYNGTCITALTRFYIRLKYEYYLVDIAFLFRDVCIGCKINERTSYNGDPMWYYR